MSENTSESNSSTLNQMPNSDIVNLPSSGRDVQEGVEPLTPEQQVIQLSDFLEDNYPELFLSMTTNEAEPFIAEGKEIPTDLKERTERLWAKIPDLISHSSLLVLGAGLDHAMPHTAFVKTGPSTAPLDLAGLPEGIAGTILTPSRPNGNLAVSLHGGPGWVGDGISHEQLWLPLFAALAERSGTTVVDLTYPLPGGGSWDPTQAAVADACEQITASRGEILPVQGFSGSNSACGLITFGTGFVAAQRVLNNVDFHLMMTPRIPEGFSAQADAPEALVSLARMDSRGTSAEKVRAWMDAQGARYEYRDYPSEHFIAAPAVWRERVQDAAEWLAARGNS
ncbi:hypothetical protein [Corynebacterium anserum]|uniref:Uncharacterized protein n=1 Tax=Corynebacterium anserum TaxID=2684406 RepID=A0A7G7YM84_9CORY|nr:hypothetical protein [Corynebacterium anserum]MBC2680957.1 hypothetical protein [Corynebacterium anserum]QNH95604.1 hypothetical protein GP473_01925 [Corynebacterium anserum]